MDSAKAYFAMPAFPRGPWPQRESVTLAAVPSSVSRFREHVKEMLWEWKLDFLADDAEVVVSELASNSVRATRVARQPARVPGGSDVSGPDVSGGDMSGGDMSDGDMSDGDMGGADARGPDISGSAVSARTASGSAVSTSAGSGVAASSHSVGSGAVGSSVSMRLLADASRLLVLVWDGVLSPPVLAAGLPEDEEENGRGLLIVGALATCWHWYNPPGPHGGKVVWALLEGDSDASLAPPAPSATTITVPSQDCRRLESHMRPIDGSPEGTTVQTCSCGYVAATADEAYVHLSEAFIPADDRDPAGVVHAEAARESSEPPLAFRCTCGHDAGDPLSLDIHIRQALAPDSGLGLDGQRHDLAFFRPGAADA